ncbi:chitinase domain-containing protein 1 [Cajanus cajan]|uniref:Chitinase domain-containing protein 1 n=1 Tax=Cajanus cajan TaxID=3821 RepID=A0A151TXX2_CAJCA|nr:chitinase domain-containing protein 1 [Cajanus cajan]KYP71923.1 Chitinase domain-containing protein 1 [Cajanus cajan]
MAKKRSGPSGGRRENRVEPSSARVDSASGRSKLVVLFIVSSIIAIIVTYRFRRSSQSEYKDSNVYEQGLVTTHANYHHVLTENSKVSENTSQRHYTYPVLGYITPWNSRGYELAKRFNSKFTHLSPVWYDLKSQQTSLVLEGRHNADRGWMSDLKKTGEALILPRVVLEASPAVLLRKEKLRDKAINLIVTECEAMGYDGIVLESWSRWAAYGILHDPNMRNLALQFVKQLGDALHSISSEKISGKQLQLIYVIGPPSSEKLLEHDFGPKDLETLSEAVDGFSLMTYDFSNPHNPGPNAPLKWIQIVLQLLLGTSGNRAQSLAPKILLGINFYGNDFSLSRDAGGGAVIGRDYLALLEKHRPELQWDEKSGEHFFLYSDDKDIRHAVFYPSLKSISLRLEEARSWGCGISIWEIGQGLDYFFDLL